MKKMLILLVVAGFLAPTLIKTESVIDAFKDTISLMTPKTKEEKCLVILKKLIETMRIEKQTNMSLYSDIEQLMKIEDKVAFQNAFEGFIQKWNDNREAYKDNREAMLIASRAGDILNCNQFEFFQNEKFE